MKHFSLTEWADFVRAVVPEERRASMQKHLDEDCDRCKKTVELWTSVSDFTRQEVDYEPPASALRMAESYFAPLTAAVREKVGFRLPTLTFDSFEGQALAGIRGSDQGVRQLMYQSGDIFIDLRLEPKLESNLMIIVGQVVDAQQPDTGLAGLPVSLLRSGDNLSETTTNELGEFHFSFPAAQHMKLMFGMTGTPLLVNLPDPDVGSA